MNRIKISKKDLERITIYGPSGSGKTTTAKKLGEILQIHYVHLDDLFWFPNWRMPTYEVFKKIVDRELERKTWIIDGNYSKVRGDILPKATFAIFLDFPMYIVIWRIIARTLSRNTKLKLHKSTHLPKRIEESGSKENPIMAIYELSLWSIKFKLFKRNQIIKEIKQELPEGKYLICKSQKEFDYFLQKIRELKNQEIA